jgi:hypothetical protein
MLAATAYFIMAQSALCPRLFSIGQLQSTDEDFPQLAPIESLAP